MTSEELNQIKAQVKSVLTEVGYKRWERYLVKCLATMALKEARKEIEKKAQEIAQVERNLMMLHAMGGQ